MNYNLLLALSILAFGVIHSFTASNYFKTRLKRFNRIHYNLLSLLAILPVTLAWSQGYSTSRLLYRIDYPLNILFYLFMLTGAAIFILGAMEMDLIDFIGLHSPGPVEKSFSSAGIHSSVRHPLYLGLIIIIWSFPNMKVIDIVGASGFTLYMIVGAFLEESKLSKEFGEEYERYKKQTPMFIPKIVNYLKR
jgi:protein-S-isoprenylcysteine O-methyltransferase Ste14